MFFYNPINGDVKNTHIQFKARTAFIITKLGGKIPQEIIDVRNKLNNFLTPYHINQIDANSERTGKDFLEKIWSMILQVPLGIAIICKGLSAKTIGNIFYEIGMMQALGKETLVIKTDGVKIPSDFVRTEYIEFNHTFKDDLKKYITNFDNQATYYAGIADNLEKNPLLSIDYYRRAYLISGNKLYKEKADMIHSSTIASLDRAKNSTENLLINF